MSNISLTTINYLNSLYSQTQNGVKEIIGVQAFLSGPFKLIVRNNTFDDFQTFLNNGQFSTRLGTKGEERNLLEFNLSESPKKIFTYDPDDSFLTGTLNACVNEFILADGNHKFDVDISESVQRLYKNIHRNAYKDLYTRVSLNTPSEIRKHFYDTYFFNYDAFYETNASGRTYKKFPSGGEAVSIAEIVKYAMANRVNNWIKAKEGRANRTDEQFLIELEEAFLTEEYNWESASYLVEESTALGDFIRAAISRNNDNNVQVESIYNGLIQKAFLEPNINLISKTKKNFFSATFIGAEIERASTLNSTALNSLFSRIEQSGLLRLAAYAGSISQFAQQRLSSVEQLKRSALDSQDPTRDLPWLSQLNEAVQYLSRDPITLGIVNTYFPSLVSFFFDSIAVTVDYSNSGRGGGEEDTVNSLQDFMKSLEKAFGRTVDFNGKDITGSIFQLAANYENTAKKMKEALDASPYRANISPTSPDIFHLRLGASNFYVPPLTIDVNTFFKTGSLTGGALRQKSSPKFNSGYKETSIRIKLFFPNYEEIWGISIDDASKITLNDNFQIDFGSDGSSNQKIDKFLSSLRGLIAAFKYSPFLPIRNDYLNRIHGVTAVALSSMSISTVPNFPFALAVDIELLNFNHKPFLPMINDFNQAIHWGKYRQYMGKAAGALHNYVNGSFLMKTSNDKSKAGTKEVSYNVTPYGASIDVSSVYQDDKFITNIINEWVDGKNISFYVPAETQTKIFLPDSTSFRTDEEKLLKDSGSDFWSNLLYSFGIDLNESAGYGIQLSGVYNLSKNSTVSPSVYYYLKDSIDLLTAGLSDKNAQRSIYAYVATIFVKENNLSGSEEDYIKNFDSTNEPASILKNYTFQSKDLAPEGKQGITLFQAKQFLKKISTNTSSILDEQVDAITETKAKKLGYQKDSKQYNDLKERVKQEVKNGFNILVYERFFKSAPIEALMEAARQKSGSFSFREWEVPMLKIDLDPASVVVTGVSVTLGNNLAKLQLQMQDEPTYQHIGGRDTYINISMRITGESELNKIKRIFDHVNALSRLEHSTGVLGFIGIKNVITTLSGVKYVLPSNYSVNTVPNYPHVYDVNISLLDFDIFQQAREKLSSKQQRQLIEEFGSKRNPFFRIKQMWGMFNAYPDFPLEVKDAKNEVVGHLDPDFYFRSFEMFDKDVINNVKYRPKELILPGNNQGIGKQTLDLLNHPVGQKITDLIRTYSNNYRLADYAGDKVQIEKDLLDEVITYLQINQISYESFFQFFNARATNPNLGETTIFNLIKKNKKLITDAIEYNSNEQLDDTQASFSNAVSSAPYQVGDIDYSNQKLLAQIQAALDGKYSLKEEEEVSFTLDDLDFMANMQTYPIIDQNEPTKIPTMMTIGSQVYLGYTDTEKDGRFYLTIDGVNVKKSEKGNILTGRNITDDHSDPSKVNVNSSVYALTPMSEYGKPYSGSLEEHWERSLVDTQYRDTSGRMLRAFPTYMLWLIDEGGMIAGVKLFDNFYGLQSIIDFSIVSSEDLVGDTLVFRLSNLYSKLSKKESSSIFNPNLDQYGDERIQDNPSLTEGLSSVIDVTLNKARNILAHMQNDYVVDIENIRLKPGVRVHLRGGYGANPNSLQTLFNGTITEVEQGEIVTVTAQSDAIELGAVVNSTNKKGDSGKIDGGINTGLWLSEPRDLMVRLLSMGTSRFREAVAYANRGLVFSENKFGIRHFGSMIYEPLSSEEEIKHFSRVDAIAEAYNLIGNENIGSATGRLSDAFITGTPEYRNGIFGLMNQLWSNFSSQRDLEIFKRNIYPGNGTGIAQFLGGDLGDGWTSVASITPESQPNDRIDYLSRLTDRTWNSLVAKAGQETGADAKIAIENMTSGGSLIASKSATATKIGLNSAVSISGLGIAAVAGVPGIGVASTVGLLGVLSGRGGNNIMRMLGLISANDDDDMPGFDEVSFRAQTYMRTVWDLFKTCSRLLPNYIVAVRPFEDRSTVFYGKPHWLYTSGLVPITTGHPNQSKMLELGLSGGPKIIDPDYGLAEIMSHINQQSSPYADASAFRRSTEPIDALQEIGVLQQKSQSYYQASGALKGKVINFDSIKSQTIVGIDPVTKRPEKVMAKLPTNKGMVTIGFHLPLNVQKIYDQRSPFIDRVKLGTTQSHQQIPQLPPRFRFPLFAYKGIQSKYKLEDYPFQFNQISYNLSFFSKIKDELDVGNDRYSSYVGINTSEGQDRNKAYMSGIQAVYGIEFAEQLQTDVVNFENKNISGSIVANPLENFYSFADTDIQNDQTQIFMPLPESGEDFNFSEWTPPEKAIDEQFYVAMRWPYLPSASEEQIEKFWAKYFMGKITKNDLAGKVQDYKNSHVLIYNSRNNIAVVCKPAYFLWGKENTKVLRELSNTSESDDAVENTLEIVGESLFSWAGYKADSPSTTPEISEVEISAVVSPEAAYFLGVLTSNNNMHTTTNGKEFGPGYNDMPVPQECHFAFVPNTVPLGVATNMFVPIKRFRAKDSLGKELDDFVIGFGNYDSQESLQAELVDFNDSFYRTNPQLQLEKTSINEYTPINSLVEIDYKYGGNYATYFQKYLTASPVSGDNSSVFTNPVSREIGLDLLNSSGNQTGDNIAGTGNSYFAPAFSIADSTSIEARKYYDEDYDLNTSVIAGNGRTVYEAEQIWNQFRIGYHTYDSVQAIFSETFYLDPNSDDEFPDFIKNLLINNSSDNNIFNKFFESNSSARDEFSILFGNEITGEQSLAIEFARKNFIDASAENGGLVEYFNELAKSKIKKFQENFLIYNDSFLRQQLGEEVGVPNSAVKGELIKTPRQLFLTLVGIFRQTMWQDPYARAWLVLKPSRKVGIFRREEEQWDFKAVDRIFAAFINPNNTYAKNSDKKKFMQLLYNNRGEGSSATNLVSKAMSNVDNFWDRNVGVIFSAMGSALTGLLQTFKLNMMQAGYGISEAGQLGRQANILNKALNDSIYYKLGRPGSLLRSVDNPFTREYGEPVLEVREPFQRIHYLSSFSHILSNQIRETSNDVSTVITAVSDGKYPVTVALDKGASPERMNETTVETGIYFDNPVGEGFFGFLHPLLHPFETTRGVIKNVTGSPDELAAKRIALSHLKENVKDIYGGELIVVGNADIRPHDLVYIADVYERMYGLFEVEQVIHHFTSELGYITSITPNALVTVNDPARWFMTSWIDSWMNTQAIRNDTRLFLDSVRANNSGISAGGNISIDRLADNLNAQMMRRT